MPVLSFIALTTLSGIGRADGGPSAVLGEAKGPHGRPTEANPGVWGTNATYEYAALLERRDQAFTASHVEALKKYKVLFVPGLLTDVYLSIGLPYFDEYIKWLKSLGVDAERVGVESEGSPRLNALTLAVYVYKSEKPVLIVSHSKGGIDTLEALLRFPDLKEKIKGWIPIQGPFYGSPIADDITDNPIRNFFVVMLLNMADGDSEALKSLTTDVRKQILVRHYEAIRSLSREIPIVSLATHIEDEPWKLDTSMEFYRDSMARQGIRSDGLVPLESAIFPGSDYVALSEVDHAITTRWSLFLSFDRIRSTKILLAMLLNRIP